MNRSSLVIGVTALALALATAGVLVHPPAAFRQPPRLPLAGQILPAEDVPTPQVAPTDDGEGTWAVLVEEVADGSDGRGNTEPSEKPNRRKGSDDRVEHRQSHDSVDAERSESSRDDEEAEARVSSAGSSGSDDSRESATETD